MSFERCSAGKDPYGLFQTRREKYLVYNTYSRKRAAIFQNHSYKYMNEAMVTLRSSQYLANEASNRKEEQLFGEETESIV